VYARKMGHSWSDNTLCDAADGGCAECLACAYLAGAPRHDEEICWSAAEGGSLGCLVYARDVMKCTWDQGAIVLAATGGHLHILQYAKQNGCPPPVAALDLREGTKGGHDGCPQFLYAHYYYE
jgi:hypothetical protein